MDHIGWLAPDGTFLKCDRHTHAELASKILKEYYEIDDTKITVIAKEDTLFQKGWCRIGFSSFLDIGYSINNANWDFITEEQKEFIQNLFFEVGEDMTEQTINNLKDYGIIEMIDNDDIKIKKLNKSL